jgi:hypothetical protein
MPCGHSHYCEDCFCLGVERAIAREVDYPIPCGSPTCSHSSLQEVEAMLASYPTVTAGQRDDLLARYASRLPEYNTPILARIHCSNQACLVVLEFSRFLDINTCSVGDGQRVRCPDCHATTCIWCKSPRNGANTGSHTCILPAQDAAQYVASVPEDQKWEWQQCGRCNAWVGKEGEESCNHMECRYGHFPSLVRCPRFKLTTSYRCRYEFCLICGQEWEGYVLCSHGCPKQGAAVYDGEGYNEAGYHRDTGLNRAGVARALDALESDERPTVDMPAAGTDGNVPDGEIDENAERGHIYAVPYLGRIVGPRTAIRLPRNLRAILTDWKFWLLVALHIFTPYGLIVWLHDFLKAHGYAYNGWGMDREGYNIRGYSMCWHCHLLNERSGTSTDLFLQTSTESTAGDAIATVSPRRRTSPPSAATSVSELRGSSALRVSPACPAASSLEIIRAIVWRFGGLETVPFLGANREVFCEDPFNELVYLEGTV